MSNINSIDQGLLERLKAFYDTIYSDREFRFYLNDIVSVDRSLKREKKLYGYTEHTGYRLMRHSDSKGIFFVLCKI